MSDLLNLADRVEASTGADRELDARINAATGGIIAAGLSDEDYRWFAEEYEYRDHEDCLQTTDNATHAGVPRYTASLDAAMTLVPEGWTFANLSQSDSKGWWCELRHGYLTSYDKVALGRQLENASPACALTAASLRAIHARGCADGEEGK